MKTFCKLIFMSFLLWFAGFGILTAAYALNLGTNITIYDGSRDSSSSNSWYNGKNEDQEVEPGCVATQVWDLEGFFLNGSELQVIAGFDFLNGEGNFGIGDIFFDIDGDYDPDVSTTNGNTDVNNIFGLDYVLDLDVTNNSYTIYKLSSSSLLTTVYYDQNTHSNPYAYAEGGNQVGTGSLKYYDSLSDSDVGNLSGGTHYALTGIDLGFLGGKSFTVHLTEGCGNDNLMGSGTAPVPEPATLILMGMGLIGLAGFSRRKINKKA